MSAFGTYKKTTKTLDFALDIDGNLLITSPADGEPTAAWSIASGGLTGFAYFPWGGVWWNITDDWNLYTGSDPQSWLYLSVWTNWGASDSVTIDLGTTQPGTFTGSASSSCPCNVCLTMTNPSTGAADDLAQFFAREPSAPINTALTIQYIPIPGSSVTVSLTIAGHTLSVTDTVPGSPAALDYDTYHSVDLDLDMDGAGMVVALFEASVNQDVIQTLPFSSLAGISHSSNSGDSHSYGECSAGNCQGTAECQLHGVDGIETVSAAAYVERDEYGDRDIEGEWNFRRIRNANGDSLTANVAGMHTAGTGTVTLTDTHNRSFTQQKADEYIFTSAGEYGSTFDSGDIDDAIDTYHSLSSDITASSLTTAGEDSHATELLIRGLRWNALSIAQATSITVDDADDLDVTTGDFQGDWIETGGGSVALASSNVEWTGGSSSVLDRTFDTGYGFFAGYRYLAIRFKCDQASKDILVTINGKEWTITSDPTPDTWSVVIIDLALPENETAVSDGTTFRWPVDANAYPQEGPYFGIGRTDKISFSGLAASEIVTFDYVKLQSRNAIDSYSSSTYLQFLQSLRFLINRIPNATVGSIESEYLTNIGLTSFLDMIGNAIQEGYLWKQIDTGPSTTVITWAVKSILHIVGELNNVKYAGITSVDLMANPSAGGTPPPVYNDYLNSDLPAAYMYGGGALRQRSGWTYGIDINVLGSTMTIIGQTLYHSILSWPPGIGDIFDVRPSAVTVDDGTLYVYWAAILGVPSEGIVADDTHVSISGELVTFYNGVTARGTGSSDTIGAYQTTNPYGRASLSSTLDHDGDTEAFTSYTRLWQRAVFLATIAEMLSFMPIVSMKPDGHILVGVDKKVKIFSAHAMIPTATIASESGDLAPDAIAHLEKDEYGGNIVYVVGYIDPDEYKVYVSKDGGENIVEVLDLTNVASSAIVYDRHTNTLLVVYQDSVTNELFGMTSDDHGANWGTPFNLKDTSNVDLLGQVYDLTYAGHIGGAIFMTMLPDGDTTGKIYVTKDAGEHWLAVY